MIDCLPLSSYWKNKVFVRFVLANKTFQSFSRWPDHWVSLYFDQNPIYLSSLTIWPSASLLISGRTLQNRSMEGSWQDGWNRRLLSIHMSLSRNPINMGLKLFRGYFSINSCTSGRLLLAHRPFSIGSIMVKIVNESPNTIPVVAFVDEWHRINLGYNPYP